MQNIFDPRKVSIGDNIRLAAN